MKFRNKNWLNLKDLNNSNHNFSESQKDALQKIQISKMGVYNNFGYFDSLEKDLKSFFLDQGNTQQQSKEAAVVVVQIIQTLIKFAQKIDPLYETGWISLRAFTTNNKYKIPRWHTDGRYYDLDSTKQQVKLIINLKGNGTYFLEAPTEVKNYIRALQNKLALQQLDPAYIRQQLYEYVKKHSKVINIYELPVFESAIFVVGDPKEGTIHSEPDFTQNRLFLSIVPGAKVQIEALRQSWKAPKSEIR